MILVGMIMVVPIALVSVVVIVGSVIRLAVPIVIVRFAFVGMVFAHVSFVQLFGLGLTLAVLVDATVIRTILVPALMQTMGRLNWWVPGRAKTAAPEPVSTDAR